MGTLALLAGGLALIAVAALLPYRRYDAGAAVAMWSPFVQRSAASGRLTPEQVRRVGARYCAIPAALFAALFGAVLIATALAS